MKIIKEIIEELTMEENDELGVEFLEKEMERGSLEQSIKEAIETSGITIRSVKEEIEKWYIVGKRFIKDIEEEVEKNKNRDRRRRNMNENQARKIIHDKLL